MHKDVIYLTNLIFQKKNLYTTDNAKALYDCFRTLQKLIASLDTFSEHYLSLSFEEDFLKNSSFGSPENKWRFFINKDLSDLTISTKDYLSSIRWLRVKANNRPNKSFVDKIYNPKGSYSFIRDSYCMGEVGSDLILRGKALAYGDIKQYEEMERIIVIELKTYEQRLALQKYIRNNTAILNDTCNNLQNKIVSKFTIEDLL